MKDGELLNFGAVVPLCRELAAPIFGGQFAGATARPLGPRQDSNSQRPDARLQRAAEGSSDGLWEWTLETDDVWYAPRFAELLGVTPEDLPDKLESWESRLHPEDVESTWAAVHRHLETGELFDVQFRLRFQGGDYRWFRARGKAYRNARGRAELMAGSIQDSDAAVRTQELLLEKEAILHRHQRIESVDTLAGGVAHEFNNLLQTIGGYTCFAQEALEVDSQPHQDLEKVRSAVERATAITRQLLDFTRSDSSECLEQSPDEIIRDMAAMLRPLISEQIQFQLQLAAPLARVHVDQQLMH